MASKYNVGIIGYGLSAKIFHIPFIQSTPSLRIHSIVQRTPKPDDNAGKDFPSAKIYRSADEMFADSEIDIIIVTTTPETHFSFTKSALEAGKHVLVEKPFVPSSAEAATLAEIAKKSGKKICVYQNRRWDSDFLTLKRLIKEDKLGRIVEFHTHFERHKPERPTNWKARLTMNEAGGIVYDLGTHLIDQIHSIYGLPKSVTAIFSNMRNDGGEEPDTVTVLLNYGPAGPLCTVKAGIMCIETEQLRYWVRGTKGSYKKHHLDCQEVHLLAGKRPWDADYGIDPREDATLVQLIDGKPVSSTLKNDKPVTYTGIYREFVDAIEGKGEVPVKAEEAAEVLRIIEAARESARAGKTVVL